MAYHVGSCWPNVGMLEIGHDGIKSLQTMQTKPGAVAMDSHLEKQLNTTVKRNGTSKFEDFSEAIHGCRALTRLVISCDQET